MMDFQANGSNGENETSNLAEATPIFNGASNVKRVVADPSRENVVVLPAGVSLDDIKVVGDNLVIDLPDGTQMVIVNGAIYVPEFVIDGVTVPPMNLAALLNDDQPEPAAGNARSSGGNFADPVHPIQPAYALGDLLPYTELFFPEQTDEEVYFDLDLVPTAVTANNPEVLVDDDAFMGNPGGPGDDNPDPQNLTGQLDGSGGDGTLTFTFNGNNTLPNDTFTIVTDENGDLLIQQFGETVTIVHLNPDGTYSIEQVGVIVHPDGNVENNIKVVIGYTVTDEDGDFDTATFTINFDDDSPVVTPVTEFDGALLVDETDLATDDTADFSGAFSIDYGADLPGTTAWTLTVTDGANSGLSDTATGSAILLYKTADNIVEGRVGGASGAVAFTVSVDGNGVVTLDQDRAVVHGDNTSIDEPASLANGVLALTITATDFDNDPVSQSLDLGGRITFEDDGPQLVRGSAGTYVVEDELTDGNSDDDGDSTTDSASLSDLVDFGADGVGGFTFSLAGATLPALTSNGQAVVWYVSPDGLTLTGATGGNAATGAVIEIQITETDGEYSYTVELLDQVDHAVDDPAYNDDQTLSFDIGSAIVAVDGDGDPVRLVGNDNVPVSVIVTIEDDLPVVGSPSLDAADVAKLDESPTSEDGIVSAGFNVAANFNAVITVGADQPGSLVGYQFTLSGESVGSGLFTLGENGAPGEEIMLTLNGDGTVVTGSAGGVDYFTISVSAAGQVTFALTDEYANVWHGDDTNPDDSSSLVVGEGDSFGISATFTDADGDTVDASIDLGNGVFRIEDDGPSITGTPALDSEDIATLDESPTTEDGVASYTFNVEQNFAAVVDYGTDGPGGIEAYEFRLSGSSVGSGLYALGENGAAGEEIMLTVSVDGTVVTGSAGGVDYFTITVEASGDVTFAFTDAYANVWHGNTNDHDDTSSLVIDAADSFDLVATYVDADGDSVEAAIDLGNGTFNIEDDGPSIAQPPVLGRDDVAVLDESPVNEDGIVSQSFNVEANFIAAIDFGTDGPGGITDYNFKLSGSSVGSGLYALGDDGAPGEEIMLTVSGDGSTVTGAAGGVTYFTITVDATGEVEFAFTDDYANIWHENTTNPDDSSALIVGEGSSFTLEATYVDADGDSVKAAIDLGNGTFSIEDDGPSVKAGVSTTYVVEDELPGANSDNDGQSTTDTGTLEGLIDFGTDGPGSYSFDLSGDSLPTTLTSNGLPIVWYASEDGLTLVGATGGDIDTGRVITITITDAVTGAYSVELNDQVDHQPANQNDDGQVGLFGIGSAIIATDADGDSVRLSNGKVVIQIEDDLPIANPDTDYITAGGYGPATGNVITGLEATNPAISKDANATEGTADAPGADAPATLIGVSFTDPDTDVVTTKTVPTNGSTTIDGEYGVLTIYSNGDYSYVRDQGTPGNVEDVFNYTIKDADGDTATTTLTIEIGNEGVTATIPTAQANTWVYETALDSAHLGTNEEATAGINSDPRQVVSGQIAFTAPDGLGSISVANTTLDLNAGFPQTVSTDATGTLQITGYSYNPATGNGTINYTYTLANNVLAPTSQDTTVSFLVEVTDTDGDTNTSPAPDASDYLVITIVDDDPLANPDTDSVTEGDAATGNLLIGDQAGEYDFLGADETTTVTGVAKGTNTSNPVTGGVAAAIDTDPSNGTSGVFVQGDYGVLQVLADGTYRYTVTADSITADAVDRFVYTITDGDGSKSTTTLTINVDNVTLTASDNEAIVYEAGLPAGTAGPDAALVTDDNGQITILDGAVNVTGDMTFTLVTNGNGTYGTLTLDPDGSYTYVLDTRYVHGANDSVIGESFTYKATDANGNTVTGQIDVTIVDDQPTATDRAAPLPIVLDESPNGQDEGGDFTPAGDNSASLSLSALFTLDYGADLQGTTTYSLLLSGQNIGSGLYALDTNDTAATPGDGIGQGAQILLSNDGSDIVGKVGDVTYFRISVDGNGTVTFTQYENIYHGNSGNDDDVATLTTALAGDLKLQVAITDSEGDPASASVNIGKGVFQIEDDGPAIETPLDSTLQEGTGGVELTTGIVAGGFIVDPGTDGFLGGSAQYGLTFTLTGTVDGRAISVTIQPAYDTGESTATSANYDFSFVYDTDPVTAGIQPSETINGELTVDLTNGNYIVDLDATFTSTEIVPFSDVISREGLNTQGNAASQYEFVVSELDSTDPIFVLFEAYDGTLSVGSDGLITGTRTWASISNSENGVAGDTIQRNEVLDFDLLNYNPYTGLTGTNAQKEATLSGLDGNQYANGLTIQLDGFGSEDLIVVLKLVDANDPNITTTKILIVGTEDVYTNGQTIAGYTPTLDQNDGYIVIESNDFNTGSTNWLITGAQLMASADGFSTSTQGILLEGAVGDSGFTSQTTVSFNSQPVYDQDVVKISDIGLIREVETDETVQLIFEGTITDADGDQETASFTVNPDPVVPPLVLDINGNGAIDLLGHSAGVTYDFGFGTVLTAWVGEGDGILAFDANRPTDAGEDYVAQVDDASEFVFGHDGMTDLEALAADYDTNQDGVLDASDAGWDQFGVWVDTGEVGAFEDGEFHSLTDLGITSIDLTGDGTPEYVADGDAIIYQTTTFTQVVDGEETTGLAGDVGFMTVAANDDEIEQPIRQAEAAVLAAVAPGLLVAASLDVTPAFADQEMVNFVPKDIDFATAVDAITPADVDLSHVDPMGMGESTLSSETPAGSSNLSDDDTQQPASFDLQDNGPADQAADLGASSETAANFAPPPVPVGGPDMGAAVLDALLSLGAPPAEPNGEARGTVALEAVRTALEEVTGKDPISELVDHVVDKVPESAQHSPVDIGDMHALLNSGVATQHMHMPVMPDAADDAAHLAAAAA